jgi:putative intracellular protease/amidase
MRILIILSVDAAAQADGVPEFDGLIDAYYLFRDAGLEVVVAAPGGGSASEAPATARAMQRFKADREARDTLNDLVDLAAVCAGDFDGALWLASQGSNGIAGMENDVSALIVELLAAAKPVAMATPRPAAEALLDVLRMKDGDNPVFNAGERT